MCDEIRLAVDIFKFNREELWELISNGFESSFMPGSYANKLVSFTGICNECDTVMIMSLLKHLFILHFIYYVTLLLTY